MPEEEVITDVFADLKPEDFKKVNTNEPAEEPVKASTTEPEAEKVPEPEVKPESEKKEATPPEPEPEKKVETNPEAQTQADWKAELKKVNREEALKELGLDEFEIGLLKYRKETGDLTPYLEAKSVDFTKLSDEQIMRRNLKAEYKELSDEEFEILYQDEVTDRFKLDSQIFDDAQMKLGKLKLKVEAEKLRAKFIEEQGKFTAPAKPKDEEKPDNSEKEFAELKANWLKVVQENEATKELLTNKRLVLGSKDSTFNFEVSDPAHSIASAEDNTIFWKNFETEKGTDFNKFYKVSEYAKDPEKFEKALIDYGKSLGNKAVVDELKNPSKREPGAAHEQTTGDFYTDIGQAFLKNGVVKNYR